MTRASRYNSAFKVKAQIAMGAVVMLVLLCNTVLGQTKAELKASKKMYEGFWVNKKTQRHLVIGYDDLGYAELNDWTGKRGSTPVDAYKAWVKGGKLVMPESKTDLRCPYCEIVKKGNALLYRCMDMNTKDNRFTENTWFVKERN